MRESVLGVVADTHGLGVLNPGSAGPRRFRLPVACARLRVRGARLEPEILTLA